MLWKLDALQTFISDLHWPDEVFAKHLEQRLKLMAADMIESCVKRYATDNSLYSFRTHFLLTCGEVSCYPDVSG